MPVLLDIHAILQYLILLKPCGSLGVLTRRHSTGGCALKRHILVEIE